MNLKRAKMSTMRAVIALIACGMTVHAGTIPVTANVAGQGNVQIGSIDVDDNNGMGGGITAAFTLAPAFAHLDNCHDFRWIQIITDYRVNGAQEDHDLDGNPDMPQPDFALPSPPFVELPFIDPAPGPFPGGMPYNNNSPFYPFPTEGPNFEDARADWPAGTIITFNTFLTVTGGNIPADTACILSGFEWTYTQNSGAQNHTATFVVFNPAVAAVNNAITNGGPAGDHALNGTADDGDFGAWTVNTGCTLRCPRKGTNVPAGAHSTSETWTADESPYRLRGQVYFTNNSTLTIEPGVIVASLPEDQGSLAICKDAQIVANGTQELPIIFTSTNDVATWSGTTGFGTGQLPGDPRTGTWREAAQEWGNLTLMGEAYISEDAIGGNTPVPSASNTAIMEGLINGPSTDSYGGGNDDHDSGSVSYVSLRYGGKVVGSNVELNGLSLGGIGRDTDIHHVDIMNNIDDGVEVWGGTVNLKYMNIWNIGDDSLDIDQGWRGKAQFGLIVQGRSIQAAQGGGTGDNAIETDGAEDSFWQPVTTTTIYNYTVVGMPNTIDPVNNSSGGDHGTAWRDNARVQYRNCIFMDIGERAVSFDNVDGDGGDGYGASGTLAWPDTWMTAFNAVPAHANDFTTGTYATNYAAQSSGRLAEMTDNVFFRNLHTSAYVEANLRDVFNVANNNVIATLMPITSLTRAAGASYLGLNVANVATIDPRPANDALVSVSGAPLNDSFFQRALYRGAFAPGAQSWLCGWTAAFAFNFTSGCGPGLSYCFGDGKGPGQCPCIPAIVPPSAPEHGCANSLNLDGALLTASGAGDLSSDAANIDPVTFTIDVAHPYGGFGFLIKGNANIPAGINTTSDGIRCAGGGLIRFGGHNAGTNGNPPGFWIYPNTAQTTPVSVASAQAGAIPSYYQLFYRNAQVFCTSFTTNFSNAYQINWVP